MVRNVPMSLRLLVSTRADCGTGLLLNLDIQPRRSPASTLSIPPFPEHIALAH